MEYNFKEVEKKWQQYWREHQVYKVDIDHSKPKYYVLDMFPYPSGAGLHVGHPLGYIASDIYSRYKRLRGYNVLHPMGYDAFGLPAEQYAIQTGTHPAVTTEININRYREQLDKIGFSFDWSREVRTSDPKYYKWTQWTFIQLFHHWYNNDTQKAEPIPRLVSIFEKEGNAGVHAACGEVEVFTATQWNQMTEVEQQQVLMQYRLAYLDNTMVNWCPALGTVLANDEVSEGLSVRGGHPVERKTMKQWLLRITAYADRLLEGLDHIEWSDSLKEIQRNWIGKSTGGAIRFALEGHSLDIEVFTTRPDTIFGATFMVLAPEHPLVARITTPEQQAEVEAYVQRTKNRSERERMAEVKKVSGAFTGAYAINPFNQARIPVWIADYVLMGYGTGAIMAVPAHDSRDFAFARHFNLPIIQVISRPGEQPSDPATWNESYDSKEGIAINSGFINGLEVKDAIEAVVAEAGKRGIGTRQTNYRLRDAIFSRQRYWGEPFPVYYKDGMPYTLPEDQLPLELPPVDAYLPTESGEPPLARAKNWHTPEGYPLETNTMPGFAGSSGYYLRYMDPHNNERYFSDEAIRYWQNVDLYIGGAEHATGHLIYARFWNMFLYDLGMTVHPEPFKKLINQGMIQGRSNFVYRIAGTNTFVSANLRHQYEVQALHVDVNLVHNDQLDLEAFRNWQPQFADAEFILENGKYICGWEVEKMSKSKYNVQNPDDLIEKYGADTLRLYEMFLGPLEQSKPWDTQGIEGVFRFIRKLWRLFHDENNKPDISEAPATEDELRVLHRTIKKVEDDIERFSFNTAVSAFMICVNELTELHCRKRQILQPLTILISAYAPHIAEELWQILGHTQSVVMQQWPQYKEEYLSENTFTYPVSFNGKTRFKLTLPADMSQHDIEKAALEAPETARYTEGKPVRKVIVVPKRIINIVV
ncbi:MAG: leucine--tRNA ligase [Bacteroidetes bacterium]|nr:leucine--tRNA ligase [Bacteroidota bacterium]